MNFTNGLAFTKFLLYEKSLEFSANNRKMPKFPYNMIVSNLGLKT